MYTITNKAYYETLKRNAIKQKEINASINTSGAVKGSEQNPPLPPNKRNIKLIKLISKKEIQ